MTIEKRPLSDAERIWTDNIFRAYYRRIKAVAFQLGKNRYHISDPEDWAEDITQDVFLCLTDHITEKDLMHHPNIGGWLMETLKGKIGNYIQKQGNWEITFAEPPLVSRKQMSYEDKYEDKDSLFPQGRTGDGWNQIQKHEDAERVKTLTGKLEEYLNSATEETADMDKLDGILSELEKVPPLPDGDAFDAERGLERFYERLAARKAAESETPAEKDIISSSLRRSKKRTISRVLLIAAVLTLILATTAQAFRFVDIFDLFARWGSEVFGFQTDKEEYAEIMKRPLAIGETREYASVQDMMDDFGITVPLFPTWVPERFGEPTVYAKNTDMRMSFFSDFNAENAHLHIRFFEILQDLHDTEKDTNDSESEWIKGTYFYFMSDDLSDPDDRLEKVAWQNGQFECLVYGTVSRDELRQVIYSIYER